MPPLRECGRAASFPRAKPTRRHTAPVLCRAKNRGRPGAHPVQNELDLRPRYAGGQRCVEQVQHFAERDTLAGQRRARVGRNVSAGEVRPELMRRAVTPYRK